MIYLNRVGPSQVPSESNVPIKSLAWKEVGIEYGLKYFVIYKSGYISALYSGLSGLIFEPRRGLYLTDNLIILDGIFWPTYDLPKIEDKKILEAFKTKKHLFKHLSWGTLCDISESL